MLPVISLVNSVEMVRDGGSLAAVFQGLNGAEYVLLFPLRRQELPSGAIERLGYCKPVVIERQAESEIEVSWQHAIILIHQIRRLVREPGHLEWLAAMEATADTEGSLPEGVERFLPAFRPAPDRTGP